MAYVLSQVKDYSGSFKYSNLALSEWEKRNYMQGIAELMFHKAYLQMNNGDEQNIIPECRKALSICKKHGLLQTEIQISSWLGGYYLRLNQPDSALLYYQVGLNEPGVSTYRLVFNFFDIGNCYMVKENFQKAEYYYKKTLELCRKHNLKKNIGLSLSSIANVQYSIGNFDKAEKLMLECIPEVPEMDRLEFRRDIFGTLMDINEKQKDYENAFKWAKMYQLYVDSTNNDLNQNEYMELQEKYQNKLKDKTIREKDMAISEERRQRTWLIFAISALILIAGLYGILLVINRKRMESKLQESIIQSEMKALRAQMNPHFMFNSLNAIQQMVLNDEKENAYRYLGIYGKLTRQILENSEKKWISIHEEIRFLELYLKMESLRFDHSFTYEIITGEDIFPNTDKIPAMVIQPLVENAIKHGLLPKKGEKHLTISFLRETEDGPLEVWVEDNGVGRVEKKEKQIGDQHHSMSLGITENRLKLLSAGGENKLVFEDLKREDGSAAGTLVKVFISA